MHLIDPDGNPCAVHDGEPSAEGKPPAGGWGVDDRHFAVIDAPGPGPCPIDTPHGRLSLEPGRAYVVVPLDRYRRMASELLAYDDARGRAIDWAARRAARHAARQRTARLPGVRDGYPSSTSDPDPGAAPPADPTS